MCVGGWGGGGVGGGGGSGRVRHIYNVYLSLMQQKLLSPSVNRTVTS